MKKEVAILFCLLLCFFLFENSILKFTGRAVEGCQPNWVQVLGQCNEISDSYTVTYRDENNCETNESKPVDVEYPCLGRLKFNSTNIKILPIKKENKVITKIAVPSNISLAEILKEYSIQTNSENSKFGYTIVKNIPYPKIIYVEKKSRSSDSVCVKDIEINSINDMSQNCRGESEFLLKCPSVYGQYSCELKDNFFEVQGLSRSAVKEVVNLSSSNITENCTPVWRCTEWSNCSYGKQVRSCIDINYCGIVSGKPSEEIECSSDSEICEPNWICTGFGKCENGIRKRECSDLFNCGVDDGKPNEEEKCENSNIKTIYYFILLIIVILISLILILIYRRFKKMKLEEEQNALFKYPGS